MVHFLGHYFDPTAFWCIVGILGAGLFALVFYIFTASRNQAERIEGKVDVLMERFGQMQAYLDGLTKSEPAVRNPFELGRAAMDASKWDEAIGHFREAVKEAKGTQLVALYNLVGLCYYTMGRLDSALRSSEESVRLAEESGDKQGKAVGLGNIGLICSDKGEPDKALRYHEEALAMAREIGDHQGVANQLGNIGLVYRDKGESDKALKYHEEALAIDRKVGDQQGTATQLGNIGITTKSRTNWVGR